MGQKNNSSRHRSGWINHALRKPIVGSLRKAGAVLRFWGPLVKLRATPTRRPIFVRPCLFRSARTKMTAQHRDPFPSQIWITFGSAADTKRMFSLLSSLASAHCMCCLAHLSSNHPPISLLLSSLSSPTHPPTLLQTTNHAAAPDKGRSRGSVEEAPEPGQRRRR